MSAVYVAPSEPRLLREAADHVSQHPERFGVDVLIVGTHHTVGIQRKTVSDLLASLDDGRLAEQSVLMKALGPNEVVVMIEGSVRFINDVLVTGAWGESITRRQFKRVCSTLRNDGIHIERSEELADTLDWINVLSDWADVETHSTLQPMSAAVKGDWGEKRREHYQVQMLMGLPGVGKGLAQRIVDTIGNPLRVVPGLRDVRGIGKGKYDKIMEIVEEVDGEMERDS